MADHHHHGGCCDHNHGDSESSKGDEYSLYLKIDKNFVQCLNESVEGSAKDVFRPWDERLIRDKVKSAIIGYRFWLSPKSFNKMT